MKRMMAILISLALALSVCAPAFAAEDSVAKSVLEIVKGKIDVSENLTVFEYSESTYSGKKMYDFNWHDEDYDNSLNVSADEKGRISTYSVYGPNIYPEGKKLIKTTEDEALKAADEFIRRALPEMFENENDTLVLNGDDTTVYANGGYKSFTFVYERMYGGIYVLANTARVSVVSDGTNITVQDLYAKIDYDAEFEQGDYEKATRDEYIAEFPARTYYVRVYEDGGAKVHLAYSVDAGMVENKTAKRTEPEGDDGILFENEKPMQMSDAEAGGSGRAAMLTQQELDELAKMNELIPTAQLEKTLRELEEFNVTDDMKLTNAYTQKLSEGEYYTSISLSDDNERYLNANFDAVTGKLFYVYNSVYRDKELTDEEKKTANEKAKAFIEKMNPTEIKEAEYDTDAENVTRNAMFTRVVNGVRYSENFISASYSVEGGMIDSYNLSWDEDVSDFPDPAKALGVQIAYDKAFEKQDLREVYAKTDGLYRRCTALEEGIAIDALTGEELYKSDYDETPEYTDIDGHWAEDMIKDVADYGIYLDGEEFRPDEGITQEDMFRIFGSLFYYSSYARGDVDYKWLINYKNVLAEEEKAPEKIMTREEGFKYFIRFAGHGEVAELDIFKPTFEDADKFEGSIGSAEILRAMGIMGADGYARPDENLTRAEAVVLIYNYLNMRSLG